MGCPDENDGSLRDPTSLDVSCLWDVRPLEPLSEALREALHGPENHRNASTCHVLHMFHVRTACKRSLPMYIVGLFEKACSNLQDSCSPKGSGFCRNFLQRKVHQKTGDPPKTCSSLLTLALRHTSTQIPFIAPPAWSGTSAGLTKR